MSREDFLSSNLYGMRDRLRRNSERIQTEKEGRKGEPEAAASSPVTERETAPLPPPEKPVEKSSATPGEPEISLLPVMNIPHEGSAVGKERRELEGNLLRDCAYADELLQNRRRELQAVEEFRNGLYRQLRALREFDGEGRRLSEKEYARHIVRMRGEYFYASGKFEAAVKRSERPDAGNGPLPEVSPLPRRLIFWLMLGLLCNGLIVAAGFFCAWKRW